MIKWGRTFRVISVTLCIALILSLPPVRLFFDVANGYVVQWLVRIDARYGADVVVVSPSVGNTVTLADLAALLERVDKSTPEAVVVVPDRGRMAPLEIAALGNELTAPFVQIISEYHPLASDSSATSGRMATRPVLDAPFGHFRSHGPAVWPGRRLPSFETVLQGVTPGAFWIGYLPQEGALPTLDWKTVAAGEVPDRFLAGKLVVIALSFKDYTETPDLRMAPPPQPVPAATFVAQSLQALRDGRALTSVDTPSSVLVLALAALVAGIALVRLRDRAHPVHYLFGVVGIGAVTVILAFTTQVMFPLAEAFFGFTAAWWVHRFILDTNRRRRQRRQLIRVELDTADLEKPSASSLTEWQNQVGETARSLGLAGYSFLIRQSLRRPVEVAQRGGGMAQLDPTQRRMLKRSITLGSEGTMLLPMPNTATQTDSPTTEIWLASVFLPGGLSAGWLVHCAENVLSASPPRRAMLIAAAERLLSLHPDALADEASLTVDEQIARRARLLANEASALDGLTHTAASAFAVFDLVGILVRQNVRMREIASESGIDFAALSLVECISAVTGLEPDRAVAILSGMYSGGEAQRLSAAGLQTRLHFALRLSLDLGQAGSAAIKSLGPIVLLELIDITESIRLDDARRSVAQFFDQQLRNDFEAIDLVSEMLNDPDLDEVLRRRLLKRLNDVTRRMTVRMETFDTALGEMTGRGAAQTVPQELRRALDEVCDLMIRDGKVNDLRIEYERPMLLSLVQAGVEGLPDALRALGKLCIADAPSGSTVTVTVVETPIEIVTSIRSSGHGLPEEVVEDVLGESDARLPEELQEVAEAAAIVRGWGGRIALETGLDQGLTCILSLERVM